MDHFSDGEWLDLVRGVMPAAQRDAMEQHLCTGCGDCLESYSVWARLAAFVEEEHSAPVPEWTVRMARTCFSSRPPVPQDSLLATLVATLTFDSRRALPAGVRSAHIGARHLLYAASPYAVDLYVESIARTEQVLLTGQIANTQQPGNPPKNVEVSLSDGVRQFAPTSANSYGEFQCEFVLQPRLVLIASVNATHRIEIPLDVLLEPAAGPPAGH
jgi:hypothetical protein